MNNQDSVLKQRVKEIFKKSFDDMESLTIDREVSINYTGSKDSSGEYESEMEFDVVVNFTFQRKKIMLFIECENSKEVDEPKKIFRHLMRDIQKVLDSKRNIVVIKSLDKTLKKDRWVADKSGVCYVLGPRVSNFESCKREAERSGCLVWGDDALRYFELVIGALGASAKYEILKEFGLRLDSKTTDEIEAIEIRQKSSPMYVAAIPPSLLLKICYVSRRASPTTHAYQRLLNADRIAEIRRFIESDQPAALLPNSIIIVFDEDREIQRRIIYDNGKLTIPTSYASAWIIDGQHRVFGFTNSKFAGEHGDERFDLPVIIFTKLTKDIQTRTFININYNQKKIKSDLLCDLTTITRDLSNELTWPSLLGCHLNDDRDSVLRGVVKIRELDHGRPINLASLARYGLLRELLGYRCSKKGEALYAGPLFSYAPFDYKRPLDSNDASFKKQLGLLKRYFRDVQKNTTSNDENTNPWLNKRKYALLKPTGINALLLVLTKILKCHPKAQLDMDSYLTPLRDIDFSRRRVADLGGGWKGFRALANKMIRRINAETPSMPKLELY